MLGLATLSAVQIVTTSGAQEPVCRAAQLRLSLDGRNGDFDGMSHSGTELSIRNVGSDCVLPALPAVQFLDARDRPLPASRQAPVGMHPGPVMLPVRLAAGKRVSTDLRWVSGPVFTRSRSLRAARVAVQVGGRTVRTPITAVMYGDVNRTLTFEQSPLHADEGMEAG